MKLNTWSHVIKFTFITNLDIKLTRYKIDWVLIYKMSQEINHIIEIESRTDWGLKANCTVWNLWTNWFYKLKLEGTLQ